MQDAADAMIWETFRFPGTTEPATLPPQPSRSSSLGQPLQLLDSNQPAPYIGKGKGRARDVDETPPSINAIAYAGNRVNRGLALGGFEGYYASGLGSHFQPTQETMGRIGNFGFIQEQMLPWQSPNPDYLQPGNMNPSSQNFQLAQAQTHPHAHPPPVREGEPGPTPRLLPSPYVQRPLQHTFQPPPGFPQRPHSPGLAIYPGGFGPFPQPTSWLPPSQPAQEQNLPPPAATSAPKGSSSNNTPQPSGYRFRPGLGFVCRVCGHAMRQPGLHRFLGREHWCWADGPGMRQESALEDQRRHRDERPRKVRRRGWYI